MKLFLKRVALFFAIPLCLLLVWFPTIYVINNRKFVNYKVAPAVNSLFIGDSHVQHAIDDKLLPNIVNLSQSAESLLFTYYKIKTVVANNPSIKKVYLGFSYHSISSYFDGINNEHSADISAKYFLILPDDEKKHILQKSRGELPRFMMNVIISGTKNLYIPKEYYSFMGFYAGTAYSHPAVKASMDKRLAELFYSNGKPTGFSAENIGYLQKINNFCRDLKIELILLNTPLHPYFKNNIPLKFIEKYNEVVKENNLRVFDFNNLVLNDSCFMPDGDHISTTGSVLTTNQFRQ